MGVDDVSVVRTDVGDREADLRELLRDYFAFANERGTEYFEELSGIDVDEAVESDLDRLASADVDEPLFLALAGDDVVGAVQLKRLSEATAEVKRLYVVPARRGEGAGRRLMEALIDGATDDGFTTLRLGVGPYLETARALYESLGFEHTPPYERSNSPEAVRDEWGFMRLALASD